MPPLQSVARGKVPLLTRLVGTGGCEFF